MELDHVAIAVRDHREALRQLTNDLGGKVFAGGAPAGAGFRTVQVRLGRGSEGMSIELLEPWRTEANHFLERFLDEHGEGVHHVTFKVGDVAAEVARLRSLGIDPVGVDFSDPAWREMFVHPKNAHGTLIQIAQPGWSPPPMEEWLAALPEAVAMYGGNGPWWDQSVVGDSEPGVILRRLVISTPDLEAGVHFYGDILGGSVTTDDDQVDIAWTGGTISLEASDVARPRPIRLEVSGSFGDVMEVGGAWFVRTS